MDEMIPSLVLELVSASTSVSLFGSAPTALVLVDDVFVLVDDALVFVPVDDVFALVNDALMLVDDVLVLALVLALVHVDEALVDEAFVLVDDAFVLVDDALALVDDVLVLVLVLVDDLLEDVVLSVAVEPTLIGDNPSFPIGIALASVLFVLPGGAIGWVEGSGSTKLSSPLPSSNSFICFPFVTKKREFSFVRICVHVA